MAKIRLSAADLNVESFEVLPPVDGEGTVQGFQEGWDPQLLLAGTISCAGTCVSCPTRPCDPFCTSPATCVQGCEPAGTEVEPEEGEFLGFTDAQ